MHVQLVHHYSFHDIVMGTTHLLLTINFIGVVPVVSQVPEPQNNLDERRKEMER